MVTPKEEGISVFNISFGVNCPVNFDWVFLFFMKKISIIVPVLNEEKNITPLLARINRSLNRLNIVYEVIFVDDHSTDSSVEKIISLAKKYPVKLLMKKGKKGKSFSLLEGFRKAKYEIVCMIDADLQYPPEEIAKMLLKLDSKTDIVIAKRYGQVGVIRRILSTTFYNIFSKKLHNLDTDVQSGLKVFKKEIIERIKLSPSPWSFDLEFLIKARLAGYNFTNHKIVFHKRRNGKSKLGYFRTSFEIGFQALKVKFLPKEIVPFHKKRMKLKGEGFHYNSNEYTTYTNLRINESAFYRISNLQKYALLTLLTLLVLGILLNAHSTAVFLIAVLTTIYIIDLFFNFFLVYRSFSKEPEIEISERKIAALKDYNWPVYTIFCPLYKEWSVIPQFIKAMSELDYPKNKLQVLLLLEEDDKETIEKVKEFKLPSYFDVKVIPHSVPKTKPKALNYGLKFTRGDFAVIYDAEDIPEPLQLKKSVLAFKNLGSETVCIQAKLNFYNPQQNILTRLFTAEYSLWFDLVLTGLQSIHAPIPLGGTSNHFRTDKLKELQGWDAFNVTEDADLGMRIIKRGYKTAVINSYTMEEANSDFINWFKQRSRWIKGYMQTYLVHMRDPRAFVTDWKRPHFITFQIIIGGKILSMLINPLMWILTLSYIVAENVVGPAIKSLYPTPILYMGVFSLIVGNFLYSYYYILGVAKRKHWEITIFSILTPLYWLTMSAAAFFAFYEIIVKPHYWHKTKHGLHLSIPEKKSIVTMPELRGGKIAVATAS